MSVDKFLKINKVSGKNNSNHVFLYTLSSCGWCNKTKKFLKDHDVEYEFVDVDRSTEDERKDIIRKILDKNGRLSYPAIIINDTTVTAPPAELTPDIKYACPVNIPLPYTLTGIVTVSVAPLLSVTVNLTLYVVIVPL